MERKSDIGGYDIGSAQVYNNKQSVLPSSDLSALKCSVCSLLLRDPCQVITCGHRYCRSCIDQLTSGGEGPYSCVVDKNEVFNKNEIRSDKGCLRDLKSLEVDCPTEPPCGWRGKLMDIDAHRESCPNRKSLCSQGCGGLYKAADMETHMTKKCSKRPVSCKHCTQDISLDSIKEHNGVCEEHPVPCDYCQKKLSARKHLSEHLEQECEEYLMQCPKPGCKFKGRKSEMTQHTLSKHLLQSMEIVFGMGEKVIELESENKTLRNELTEFRETVTKLLAHTNELEQESKQKSVDIESLKSIVEQLQMERDERDLGKMGDRNAVDTVERDGPTKSHVRAVAQSNPVPNYQLKSLAPQPDEKAQYRVSPDKAIRSLDIPPPRYEPVYSLTGTVPDVARPDVELSRVKQEVEVVHSKIRQLNDIVQSSQDSQTRVGVAIDEIRLRQDVLDVKTTNGILIWKIPDIRRRYRDAVDRRTISLYSPPFYTSPHGYRMCIRTYLNGDGIGKGTHLSLFFVVMRSEQDNLLPWPFKQSVRFTLVNQKNPSSSITEAFVPDLNSPSFQKPENDMNIASGFPKFSRQTLLQDEEFTLGNMIYIKCQVDLAGLANQ